MNKLALKIGATAVAFMPAVAFAQSESPRTDIITTGSDLENLLGTIRDWFYTIFLVLAVIFLIWAAFLYLTAAGNEDKVSRAKTALIYSIVAIAVAVLAGSLTSLIANVLGG